VHVDSDKFRFVAGEDLIQSFESGPGSFRNFCRVCSSTVPGKAAYLTTVSIPAKLFDDDPGVRPKLHNALGRDRRRVASVRNLGAGLCTCKIVGIGC
jgi:hypothetical protein